jgi:hypothetical protein
MEEGDLLVDLREGGGGRVSGEDHEEDVEAVFGESVGG